VYVIRERSFREDGIEEREKEISRIRIVRRNSYRSCRPIFYFVPEETQRHLCHKPKTRYVLADYGWSSPYQNHLSKLSTSEIYWIWPHRFVSPPSSFFSGGGNAQRSLIREKLSIRTCMAPSMYTVTSRQILSGNLSLLFFPLPCFLQPARCPDV